MDRKFINSLNSQIVDIINSENPENLSLAVLQCVLLSEYLIKEVLKEISPLAPYSLNNLHYSHLDFAALINGTETSAKLKYGDIGVLLDRTKALEVLDFRIVELIGHLINTRNGIMHDPYYKYNRLETHALLLEHCTDSSEILNKYLGTNLDDKLKSSLKNTRTRIEAKIASKLENTIKRSVEIYKNLTKVEKTRRIKLGATEVIAEDILINDMSCPACCNNSLYYAFDIWFMEYERGEHDMSGETWLGCPVCELIMSEYNFEELNVNPNKYTPRSEPDKTWEQYFNMKHDEENMYEYM